VPLNGTFPYYSDGVAGEKYGAGNYKATNGRLYKVSTSGAGTPLAWYPAPGFRDAGNNGRLGDLTSVGRNGYSWSFAVSRESGVFLYFGAQSLNTSTSDGRGHGLPLRCLSDAQRLLARKQALPKQRAGSTQNTRPPLSESYPKQRAGST